MKSTYTLHKLPQGCIVTSDEEIRDGELFLDIKLNELFKCHSVSNNIQSGLNGRQYHPRYDCFKVIAQQDQIDFSSLSEEEQKEIGWFDVENLAIQESNKIVISKNGNPDKTLVSHYINAFQKAQELLSDRRFSLDEVRQSFWKCFENRGLGYSVTMGDLEVELSKSLSQKSWKVELEMELNLNGRNGLDRASFIPKLTSDKIKILKLCQNNLV